MQHILDVMKKMNGVDDDGYKTMTVDEVAEIVEGLLLDSKGAWSWTEYSDRYCEISRDRSRAIAEALRGVIVKQ